MRASGPASRSGDASLEAQSRINVHSSGAYHIRLEVASGDVNKYPAKQHARKVAAKLGATHGLIYLAGEPTINWGDSDQARPFRQRRYFYYLSGVDEPDYYLTYDIYNDLLTLYVPDFDLHRAIWMGPTVTKEEAEARYDVHRVNYFASLKSDIKCWADRYNRSSPIYILHETQKPNLSSTWTLWLDAEPLQPAMDAARGVKDHHEIELIRQANHVSGLAHRKILETIRGMTNETEIEASFLNTCVSHGAKHQAYEIIVGSGENAAVLHYIKNDEPLKGRQLVCLDAGAEWDCYASDVTRTFPLSLTGTWPSAEARDTYQLVEEMQEECVKRIKPGVRFLDLHVLAHEIAIRGLQKLGIMRDNGTVDGIRQSGASRIFFPHGLGHHVGLEVHDVSERALTALGGSNNDNGDVNDYNKDVLSESGYHNRLLPPATHKSPCTFSAAALEEGMVVTVEPGIYFSRLALDDAHKNQPALAQFIDFAVAERYVSVGGVRIEDDILVTASAYENLTTAPKGREMLEIIQGGIAG